MMHSGELQRQKDPITVFMGVPTMYAYLLSAYQAMDQSQQQAARQAARRLRLAVCGSAPCPAPVYQAWEQLAGARPVRSHSGIEAATGAYDRSSKQPSTVACQKAGHAVGMWGLHQAVSLWLACSAI